MYSRNYTGTSSHVLCREVYYTVFLFGRVHYRRSHCIINKYTQTYVYINTNIIHVCRYVRMYV